MNRLLTLSIAICSITSIFAQDCPVKKGFAYQRSTIPGKMPRKILNESGKEMEVPVKMMNTYFIYVETKKDCTLQATKIWISGKTYHVIQEEVMNMPVVLQPSNPAMAPDTIVRQTSNRVYRIQPNEEWKDKAGKIIINKQTGAKIIIEYIHKSRIDYYKIHDIQRIAPMVLQ